MPALSHLDGVQHIDGAHDVVGLGENALGAREHGVGRRALLPEVNHAVWSKALYRLREKLVVADVPDEQLNLLACQLLPFRHTLMDGGDGRQRVRSQLGVHPAAHKRVYNGNFVSLLGQVQRRRPTAVPAQEHG